MIEACPDSREDEQDIREDTQDVDLLVTILEEVKKIREIQDRQAEELDRIQNSLDDMTTRLDLVQIAQVEHGKALGSLEFQCARRLETCLDATRRVRDRADGKDRGSKPVETG